MSTKPEAVKAISNLTARLEPLMLQLSNIGKQFAELTAGLDTAHEESQLAAAIADALELPVQIVDRPIEVLPPNFLDVKAFANAQGVIIGATGNKLTDDTEMLQLASDTAVKLGMVCYFSKGDYLVDAIKSLRPKTGSDWFFHPEATLHVIPNAAQKTNCVLVDNCRDVLIFGIRIRGDRLTHDYSAPGTEEWGHGIKVIGATTQRITVRRGDIRHCHGDGISASGEGFYLYGSKLLENRRQGLTIGGAKTFRIIENEISKTGSYLTNPGTAPMAGIDMEPDANAIDDVLIEFNTIEGNATAGVLMWMRSEVGKTITNVIIRNNRIASNANQILSKALAGAVEYQAYGNYIKRKSTGGGIRIEAGTQCIIGGLEGKALDFNTFATYDEKRADFSINGRNSSTTNDIQVITAKLGEVTPVVQVNWNNYK